MANLFPSCSASDAAQKVKYFSVCLHILWNKQSTQTLDMLYRYIIHIAALIMKNLYVIQSDPALWCGMCRYSREKTDDRQVRWRLLFNNKHVGFLVTLEQARQKQHGCIQRQL